VDTRSTRARWQRGRPGATVAGRRVARPHRILSEERLPQGITGVPAWSYATYSCVRVYAHEDFSALYTNGPLQWDDVYNAALRYYFLLFPAMSTFIQLNDEASIVSHADVIRHRLNTPDMRAFFTTYNMPATRTMSPSKVKLILDFIEQQTAHAQPRTT
jgi:hypothetical protein